MQGAGVLQAGVLHQSLVSCKSFGVHSGDLTVRTDVLYQNLLPCCANAGQDAGISDGSCDMLPDSLLLHIFSCVQSLELCR